MARKEKLIARLLSCPKDFTWDELVRLLEAFGYEVETKGRSSGSRVQFWREGSPPINLHRPHPGNILKRYQVRQLIDMLDSLGFLRRKAQR